MKLKDTLLRGGLATMTALAGSVAGATAERPSLAHGAREDRTCVGSRTVTWTDAILTWDPETLKNSKVYQFERTLKFPCVVPKDSPNMCMRADPKDTIVLDEKDGTTPRLTDVIPFTTEGCRWVVDRKTGGKSGR